MLFYMRYVVVSAIIQYITLHENTWIIETTRLLAGRHRQPKKAN